MSSDEELRQKARKTAEAKAGFCVNLGVYIVVNSLLIAIWWFTGGFAGLFPWFIFPLLGWGAGLAAHYAGAFRGTGYLDRKTEERPRTPNSHYRVEYYIQL